MHTPDPMTVALPNENRSWIWLICLGLLAVFVMANGNLPTVIEQDLDDSLWGLRSSVDEGQLARRVAFVALGLFGLIGVLKKSSRRLQIHGWLGILTLAAVVWCLASVTWSIDPSLSMRRLIVLVAFCLAALAVVKHFTFREVLILAAACSAAHLAGDLLAAVATGTFHPWNPEYRFSGLLHPNYEAVTCAVLLLSAMSLARSASRGRVLLFAAAGAAFALLILTKSRTSLIAVVAGYSIARLLTAPRLTRVVTVLWTVTAGSLALLLLGDWAWQLVVRGFMLDRAGSNLATLSGRLPLWEELIPLVHQSPIFGYGYNCFWTPLNIDLIGQSLGWAVPHAHSDYFEILLGLGFVGLGLAVAVLVASIGRACRFHRADPAAGYDGLCAWLCFCAVGGLAESVVLQPSLFQLMLMCGVCHLAFRRPEPKGPQTR